MIILGLSNKEFIDIIGLRDDMMFNVSNVYNHSQAPLWRIEQRVITNNMLVMAKGGTGAYVIDGVCYPVKPGRVFLISHDVVHSAFQDENDPVSVIAVRFSSSLPQPADESFPKCSFVYDPNDKTTLFGILMSLVRMMQRYTLSNTDINITSGLLKAFFMVLLGEVSFYSNDYCYDSKMETVNSMIESRIRSSERIELELFLKSLNISKYEFSHRFVKYFKMPFRKYIFEKRMAFAEELLMMGDLTIKEIAYKTGYSDRYIFSNQFKRTYGCSPRKYRQNSFSKIDSAGL